MQRGDARAAEKAFARAAKGDPAEREYSIDQEIAHEHGITQLVQDADKARIEGHPEIAEAKLEEALKLDPRNLEVSQHIDDLASLTAIEQPPPDASVTLAPPIEMAPEPGLRSFHLKGPAPQLLRSVLGTYGITPAVDETVPVKAIHFDADNVDFAHAADLLMMASGSFMVPLDPKRVLVAKDTKQNHTQYDRMALETLRLPGLTPAEMTDIGNLARNVLGVERSSLGDSSGTLTVRAPRDNLVALNRTLADLLQGRSEVLLDVKVYQIAQTKTRNIGLQTPPSVTLFNVPSEVNSLLQQNQSLVQAIISSGLANAGDLEAIAAILVASGEASGSILSQPFALFGGGITETGVSFTGITANLDLNSSDTRALDEVQLRLEDHEDGTIRAGLRYPIETSTYSSLATSSVSIPGVTSTGLSSALSGLTSNLNNLTASETIPQVEYEDLGLTLKVTPAIERTDDIALKLDFALTALEGTSLNGLPVINNTSFTQDVVVKNGESALLVADMSRQQSNAVTGLPGLSELPGFQSTTNSQTEMNVSDLVIMVTPHLVRRRHVESAGPLIVLPRS